KGTDFAKVTDKDVKRVEKNLNNRPRKRLGYLTPLEVFTGATQI
ncbi:MAG: IS30 family transposase, partial [Candidatus Taylorbacteria bacterium]|nr:IS30 family transposase [Candidatus Taylorbacteria bacterium]